ncbi:SusC/RagA family TonB-linked outer membrane protein [Alistipes shahii]
MKNSYKYLMGTALLLFTATVYGAARHDGPDSSEAITTVEALRTDSIVKADRAMRIYQKLDMPYGRTTRKEVATGNATTYYEQDIDKYPTNDFRNSLTGVIAGLAVREQAGIPGVTYAGGTARTVLYTRSFSPVYVVDGMPVYMTQLQLDPEEIESMTLIRDVADKALFGSRAANGILNITTKRGLTHGRSIKFGFESGVSVVDRFPEWADGVEYARLNNQARINSGYTPLYSDEAIAAYARKDPNDLQYPNVDYRSMMFSDTRPYYKANVSIDGGTQKLQYSSYIGYTGEGDIYKVGSKADFNRINVRTYLKAAITKDLDIDFGFAGGLTFRRQPRYGYGSSATIEFENAISEVLTVPALAFPLVVSRDEETGNTIYGVSSTYPNNPYASLTENGFSTDRGRSGVVNATLTYDLGSLVKGLKFQSYVGLNLFNMTRIGKNPDYTAVIYDPATGESVKTSHEGTQVSGKSNMGKWTHQGLYLHEKLNYEYRNDNHRVGASATYYLESVDRSGNSFRERQQTLIGTFDYAFRDKYLFQAVVNYAGSSMFLRGKRYGTFPSFGVGWVISEEGFMQDVKWVNYLKIRGQAGIIGHDTFGSQELYEDYYVKSKGINFGPYTTGYQWIGKTNSYQSYVNTISRLGNPDLTWEKRKEVTVGIDAMLFGNRLSVEASYYNALRDGIITDMSGTLPALYGMDDINTYENYNRIRYQGWEAALYWSDRIGEVHYTIGGSLTTTKGKYLRYNENVVYDYQRVTGTMTGAYRGYVCLGKFTSREEIETSPRQLFDDNVEVGDLKYADLNGDNLIDSNDTRVIGNTSPKVDYSLSINVRYRNFDFTIVGTGRAGYVTAMTNRYFWNGWSTGSISNFVRDNIGGDYPRLTYIKATNNFQSSDFWLRDGGFFKIQNIELGYNVRFRSQSAVKGLRIFLRGANLCTISGIKDVDPENINAGVSTYPLYRTFTAGFKFTF